MTAAQVIEVVKRLPSWERAEVVSATLSQLEPEHRQAIERVLRRLQHPEIPESFWDGVEDHEDGRTVDMEAALHDKPPEAQ